MGKQNKFDSREADEAKESGKVVESNVPDTRFQAKQQVEEPVKEGAAVKTESNPFVPKKINGKGSQLKQEQVAKVITGTGGSMPEEGVASPSRAGLRTLAYSGNEGTILGNPSGTPVVGSPSRSDTRPGQKLDAVAKSIDFLANEQVYQEFDGSKPLQDNPGEVQGFLGHPENAAARMQKIAEAVPGALLFSRSCDEIRRDEIVYAEGQMIRESGIEYNVDPTMTYDPDTKAYKSFNHRRGNYIPKTMNIGIGTDGLLKSMSFDVDDVSITAGSAVVNKSSTAFIRAMNMDEINRQNMEAVAGIETEKNWCPLVRAVAQPTQTVGFLHDDEITVGTELFMGYRFLNKALAYFFNKAAKDGQTPYRSFKEALKGLSISVPSSTKITDSVSAFDEHDYVNGAPALMIALYDSIAKYSKRGDIPTQPRSWRMHKQTADNNINPFRVDETFAKYVANRDVFSTIDRGYDPLLPVCISDNWRVAHVQDFNKLMNFAPAKVFRLKMGAAGTTLAGTAFNNLFDQTSSTVKYLENATLKAYASNADGSQIYTALGYTGARNYGEARVYFAGDKTGFDAVADGQAAALDLLYEIDHFGNNAMLRPVVILFKVKGTIDDVYAICRYPNVFKTITAAPNVHLLCSYLTTANYLNSDTSVNTVLIRDDLCENDVFTYKYQNRQNPYIVEVKNALLYGLREWARNLAPKLANPSTNTGSHASDLADSQNVIWYKIPIVHSTTHVSLWDLIVCAAVPFMQKIRTNSQYDTLNYEDANGKYPYANSISIRDANPLMCVNYTMTSILEPLKVGMMKPAVALTWILPEKFWRISHELTGSTISTETFVLPFYFSEEQFDITNGDTDTAAVAVDPFVMNYPSTRAGARLAYLDDIYSMNERDVRLCLDIMTELPGGLEGTYHASFAGVYKYGLSNSGIPVFKYFAATAPLNVGVYLKTPRELGFGMVAPAGYCKPLVSKHRSYYRVPGNSYAALTDLISTGTSYEIKTWKVEGGAYQAFHSDLSVVVKRGGNFAQDWAVRGDVIYAPADNTSVESYGTLDAAIDIGIALNFNDVMEVTSGTLVGQTGTSAFKPFTRGNLLHNDNLPTILTLQNALWPRLQMLPFALSPFDQTPEGRDNSGTAYTADMTADPYDFMYIFGFCGFKGSDYREDVFNRIYEKQTLGWTYITDPFVVASPVLK